METIKLKEKKKRKIQWKRVLIMFIIVAATAICITLNACFRVSYRYYEIDNNQNKITLGVSADKNLIKNSVSDYIETIADNGFQIADFNLEKVYDKQIIITWRKNKQDTEDIQSAIEEGTYVIVYAGKITVGEDIIYIKPKLVNSTVEKIKEKDKKVTIQKEYVYINVNKVWNTDQLEDYLTKDAVTAQ